MARPCGCAGECGCTYIGIDGIRVTGTGTTRDPGRIGLTNPITGAGCDAIMTCVGNRAGAGLRYSSVTGQLSAAISSDSGNNISIGTDNGLYATGGSGGGGDGGGATVDGLAARTTPIIGGSQGAGYSMWPENGIEPYRAAMAEELDIIHAPVRRSRDGFLLASYFRTIGNYNYRFQGGTTDTYDLQQANRVWYIPGGDPSGNAFDPTYAAQGGYFGFAQRDTRGMARISDILELVQRRVVMYLEVRDFGASVNDTPTPLNTYTNLRKLITQYGAQKSVIVGSEFPTTANNADFNSILNGLITCRDAGMTIAAHITTQAMMNAVTPAVLSSNGFKWVFIGYALADINPTQVKAYKDAGLNVMLFTGNRHWHYNLATNETTFGPGALKGLLCSDPVYCAGARNGYRYRTDSATWDWGTPDYGRHSTHAATIEGQRDRYRGFCPARQPEANDSPATSSSWASNARHQPTPQRTRQTTTTSTSASSGTASFPTRAAGWACSSEIPKTVH